MESTRTQKPDTRPAAKSAAEKTSAKPHGTQAGVPLFLQPSLGDHITENNTPSILQREPDDEESIQPKFLQRMEEEEEEAAEEEEEEDDGTSKIIQHFIDNLTYKAEFFAIYFAVLKRHKGVERVHTGVVVGKTRASESWTYTKEKIKAALSLLGL
ncbi:MAG: hypothetical protein AAGL17_10080, partial [Cyanobacteria bacterium J06576_12]